MKIFYKPGFSSILTFMLLVLSVGTAHSTPIVSFDTTAGDGCSDVTSHSVMDRNDTITVDICISGLGSDALGAFDMTVYFSDLLDFIPDPVFGDQLDLTGSGSVSDFSEGGFPTPNVNLFEVSLDLAGDLLANQANTFVLASLVFASGDMTGPAMISFAGFDLPIFADPFGNVLDVELENGSITVVPEVPVLALFVIGLLAFGVSTRKRSKLAW